jgi:hypothetical protein
LCHSISPEFKCKRKTVEKGITLEETFFENMEKEQVVYEKDTFSLLMFTGKFDL